MSIDQTVSAPRGQKVLDAWSKRLRGRNFITCEDIDIPAINRELAYISLLGCEDGEFRFRLAGTGLQQVFGGEARGKSISEIDAWRGGLMWTELAARSMLRATPVSGMSKLSDGSIHFWLRLPLSSNGVEADMWCCATIATCRLKRWPIPIALRWWVDMNLRLDRGDLIAACFSGLD